MFCTCSYWVKKKKKWKDDRGKYERGKEGGAGDHSVVMVRWVCVWYGNGNRRNKEKGFLMWRVGGLFRLSKTAFKV
jgi:hypothetical protein